MWYTAEDLERDIETDKEKVEDPDFNPDDREYEYTLDDYND